MPIHKKAWEHGNLFIKFKVIFPKSVSVEEKLKVQSALEGIEGMKGTRTSTSWSVFTKEVRVVKELVPFEESQIHEYPTGKEQGEDSGDEKNDDSFA